MIKRLDRFIDSDFVLVVQWDGYVLNASRWRDEFLLFDYVGARWPHHDDAYIVGNGGFSLRSRELLKALQDPEIRPFDPEDGAICRTYRPMLGVPLRHHFCAARSCSTGLPSSTSSLSLPRSAFTARCMSRDSSTILR